MGVDELAARLLRLLPPEAAHRATINLLRLAPARKPAPDDPVLATRLWNRDLPNPIGLAAGFDKDADVPAQTLGLGFGFVEVGSITPKPQPGNPKPRVFRLTEDRAVINRYGFNSKGLDYTEARLRRFRARGSKNAQGIVGINLGKNRDTEPAAGDYANGAARLWRHADYLVANISSPNTPGLRALQGRDELDTLLDTVRAALPEKAPPLLLKLAPDLTDDDLRDIAAVAGAKSLDGLIVTNTTIARPTNLASEHRDEPGGLSGAPLFEPSTEILRTLYRLTEGAIPLVGVGGIASGADAYAKIRAGAALVQFYTAMTFDGPGLVQRIKRDLAALLRRDGFASVSDAVGADISARKTQDPNHE